MVRATVATDVESTFVYDENSIDAKTVDTDEGTVTFAFVEKYGSNPNASCKNGVSIDIVTLVYVNEEGKRLDQPQYPLLDRHPAQRHDSTTRTYTRTRQTETTVFPLFGRGTAEAASSGS
jgi:hypothetical protein